MVRLTAFILNLRRAVFLALSLGKQLRCFQKMRDFDKRLKLNLLRSTHTAKQAAECGGVSVPRVLFASQTQHTETQTRRASTVRAATWR